MNLPLMTSSRWMGCDTSRGSVPSDRSELMASNPNAMPSTGPSNTTSPANEGKVWPLMPGISGELVNRSVNTGMRWPVTTICSPMVEAMSRKLPATA